VTFRLQATLKHIYFLDVAYRLEIQTTDGLILRSRINKEEFRQYRFEVGWPVSYAIYPIQNPPGKPPHSRRTQPSQRPQRRAAHAVAVLPSEPRVSTVETLPPLARVRSLGI
jgi:hypothetical protein